MKTHARVRRMSIKLLHSGCWADWHETDKTLFKWFKGIFLHHGKQIKSLCKSAIHCFSLNSLQLVFKTHIKRVRRREKRRELH